MYQSSSWRTACFSYTPLMNVECRVRYLRNSSTIGITAWRWASRSKTSRLVETSSLSSSPMTRFHSLTVSRTPGTFSFRASASCLGELGLIGPRCSVMPARRPTSFSVYRTSRRLFSSMSMALPAASMRASTGYKSSINCMGLLNPRSSISFTCSMYAPMLASPSPPQYCHISWSST